MTHRNDRYMHHLPSFGGEEEKAELVEAQEEMLKKYEVEYGEKPTKGMWPTATPNPGGGEKMPDCCSFMCVKPSCAGCVGCNAVYCGFDGEQDLPTEVAANRLYVWPLRSLVPAIHFGFVVFFGSTRENTGGGVPTLRSLESVEAASLPPKCMLMCGISMVYAFLTGTLRRHSLAAMS